jgi:hypothetical protein
MAAKHQRHISMTAEHVQLEQVASTNRTLLASVNHGRPGVAASSRPGHFTGHGTMESGGSSRSKRPPDNRKESSRPESPPANGGRNNAAPVNPALERKGQQEQDRLRQRLAQQRQRIEQKHQQKQQRLQQQAADDRIQREFNTNSSNNFNNWIGSTSCNNKSSTRSHCRKGRNSKSRTGHHRHKSHMTPGRYLSNRRSRS